MGQRWKINWRKSKAGGLMLIGSMLNIIAMCDYLALEMPLVQMSCVIG